MGAYKVCTGLGKVRQHMRSNTQRLGLLLVSFLLITMAVAACATSQAPTSYNSNSSGNQFQTPVSLSSPTPPFPGFTVGTWPSNYSPSNTGSLTIYVICRIQDPSMQTPPRAAANVPVVLTFQPAGPAAVNIGAMTATTGQDGIAAFTFQFTDPTSGVPIIVQATATYQGVSYTAQTFFTPNPEASPTPSVTTGPGGPGGNPSPTTGP
jgi:hypothetical protein